MLRQQILLKTAAMSICVVVATGFPGCATVEAEDIVPIATTSATTPFARTEGIVPFQDAQRRKWGGPVVVDLDQDGRDDIIVTDHGYAARVFWNDGGKFSEPVKIIGGDTHGLAVADYDGDGRMDIIVARGGGDGADPKRPVRFMVNKDRSIESGGAFDHFAPGRGRAVRFFDADHDSTLDLLVTGFAPTNVKTLSNNQFYSNEGGTYKFSAHLPRPRNALSFKALTADLDNDRQTDVILYGGRDLKFLRGQDGDAFVDATGAAFGNLAKTPAMSSIVAFDYDNDGDLDLFITRGPPQFKEETYFDAQNRRFAFFEFRDDFLFDDLTVDGDLVVSNIQESYATHGVFLGTAKREIEPERPSDPHMGGSIRVKPSEAEGWPSGELKGLHIGYLGDGKWRVGGNVHSRLAAVVENVVSAPSDNGRGPLPAMLLENRDGSFVDVTASMGIAIKEQTMHSAAGDFNNDGWTDLAVSRYGNMAKPLSHLIYMNRQGRGFDLVEDTGITSPEVGATGVGLAILDYDSDGKLDLVFGNERGRWHLARNQISGDAIGRSLSVVVGTSPEQGSSPLGARVDVIACGNVQRRTVGVTSDGFHQSVDSRLHFGMGQCRVADTVTVTWAAGDVATFENVEAGATLNAK